MSDLLVTGRCDSRTTGYSYPVQVHGHAVTVFSARKRVIARDDKVLVLPAVSAARSQRSRIRSRPSLPRLRGRISIRIASREVAGSRGQVDYISARHAEQHVNRTVDQLVAGPCRNAGDSANRSDKGQSSMPMRW